MEFEIYRIIFSFISGYFLSLAGSLTQLSTGNKMASPSTLGMDGFAVLVVLIGQFALIGIEMMVGDFSIGLSRISFILFILLFGLIVSFVFIKKNQFKNIWDISGSQKIIMLGLTFNLFIGAIFSILLFLFMALNYEFPTTLWFGSFKQYDKQALSYFVVIFIALMIQIPKLSKKLELLNLGHHFALGFGHDVRRVQNQANLLALLLTGVVIINFGVFSFLGLILPHILRSFKIFATDMSRELFWGSLISGVILSGIDLACYNFTFMGAELPVGMVSGVMGSFFLIFLLLREKV